LEDISSLENEYISPEESRQIEEWAGYFSFKWTWPFMQLLSCTHRTICLFTGNQFGKNDSIVMSYILRILGLHPVEHKNMRPDTPIRTIRFASERVPGGGGEGEIQNTQDPALRKRLPNALIKRDIAANRPVMTLYDPQGGPDIHIEFVGYHQTTQSQAGVQRFSTWIDEHAPWSFYEEQVPRLIAANGDLIYSLTPAMDGIGWEYDTFFEKARTYIRTKAIRDYMYKVYGKRLAPIEHVKGRPDIAIIQTATDDNPTFTPEMVEESYAHLDDTDVIAIRRYGLFKQVSGLIFKQFDPLMHVYNPYEIFPGNGLPPDHWAFARTMDYHEKTPWATIFAVISLEDEMFIWDELNLSPEEYITKEICYHTAISGRDFSFPLNLVDPRAAIKQSNTSLSVMDDMNRIFNELKKDNIGTGGYWQSWDTKSMRGREEVKKRLKNSSICGKPLSGNKMPTLWIANNCFETIRSMRNWKWKTKKKEQEFVSGESNEPQQKWSHFPMCIEALLKHPGWNAGASRRTRPYHKPKRYYTRRRR